MYKIPIRFDTMNIIISPFPNGWHYRIDGFDGKVLHLELVEFVNGEIKPREHYMTLPIEDFRRELENFFDYLLTVEISMKGKEHEPID